MQKYDGIDLNKEIAITINTLLIHTKPKEQKTNDLLICLRNNVSK